MDVHEDRCRYLGYTQKKAHVSTMIAKYVYTHACMCVCGAGDINGVCVWCVCVCVCVWGGGMVERTIPHCSRRAAMVLLNHSTCGA